jgi:hypothetical protein
MRSNRETAMENNRRKTEFDSAIIRIEMLKRGQLTAQAKAGDDEGRSLDVDGKSVRLDPQHRELAQNPFPSERA